MRKKQKIIFVLLAVIIVVLLLGSRSSTPQAELPIPQDEKIEVLIGGKKIQAEVARSEEQRAQGLSGRESLCPDCGMLFIFSEEGIHSFWMKDMRFALDIIWLSGKRVVKIAKNVPYIRGSRESVHPDVKADRVLEINAGKSDEWGIKVGDLLDFDL